MMQAVTNMLDYTHTHFLLFQLNVQHGALIENPVAERGDDEDGSDLKCCMNPPQLFTYIKKKRKGCNWDSVKSECITR